MPSKNCALFFVILISASLSTASTGPIFKGPKAYDSGGSGASAVVVADLNGDGKPDLIVANDCASFNPCPKGSSITIFLGNGDGTFQTGQKITVNYNLNFPPGLAVGDLNGDGKPDLVTADSGLGILVFLGNGDGTFQAPQDYVSSGAGPTTAIVIADLNGDGKADLVVAQACNPSGCNLDGVVSVFLGKGDGTFQAAKTYDAGGAGLGDGDQGISLAVADINGDGKLDVVTGLPGLQGGAGSIGVLLGYGDGTLQSPQTHSSGGQSVSAVAVADLNGDGIRDVVASNYCAESDCRSGSVSVWLGMGGGALQSAMVFDYSGFGACCLAVGDINRDGKPDLVLGLRQSNGLIGGADVLLGNGDGTFQTPQVFSSDGDFATAAVLADVNGDGKLDLVQTNGFINYNTQSDGNAVVRLNIYFAPTNTILSEMPQSSVYGLPVTLTAKVTSAGIDAPSGKVLFLQNGVGVGSAVLASGVAKLTTTKLPVGSLAVRAEYLGDNFSAKSTSTAATETVTQAKITLTLASNPNPSTFGQSVKFTATLSSTGGLPGGSVTFSSGGTTLGIGAIHDGVALCYTKALPRGTNHVTAAYTGNADYSSASGVVTQVVN